MREEETPLGAMGVSIGVGKLVVKPVQPYPLVNAEVHCKSLTNGEEQAKRPIGFVGLVGPKSVTSGCD